MAISKSAIIVGLFLLHCTDGRIHSLQLQDDSRVVIDLSSFTYNGDGVLNVTFTNFQLDPSGLEHLISQGDPLVEGSLGQFGFILEKLNSRGAIKYQKEPASFGANQPVKCSLHEPPKDGDKTTRQIIIASLGDEELKNNDHKALTLKWDANGPREKGITLTVTDLYTKENADEGDSDEGEKRKRRETLETGPELDDLANESDSASHGRDFSTDSDTVEGKKSQTIQNQMIDGWTFRMVWHFDAKASGLYELTFHNCFNRDDSKVPVKTLDMNLIEKNGVHYLTAGEMALPMVYGVVSFLFFITTFVWLMVLRQKDTTVFKVHYLMLFLVFFKALSVMFHAIDFRFLDIEGQTDAWTIIFYIVHLLKGGILIVTLTLIGTGWAFIKYVLSDREKRLFAIVVPLQIFVNIAFIIFKETEEGEKEYTSWSHIMILLDLFCYALILWPVYWSIKHLQQASLTDGKAARNLEKLDLFRHFYIMFVLYIYFTRIVVYIMKITLPPSHTWVAFFCDEMATLGFFIMTGYKFRPGCNNPYFKVEEEMSEVITKTNLTKNVTKRDRGEKQNLLDESDEDEDTILDTNAIVA